MAVSAGSGGLCTTTALRWAGRGRDEGRRPHPQLRHPWRRDEAMSQARVHGNEGEPGLSVRCRYTRNAGSGMPEKTRGVVLVAPALPRRRTSPAEALEWQTLGRLVVAAGPPMTRAVLRLAGRRILDAKRTAINDAGSISGSRTDLIGGDPGRVSRAQVDLWLDALEAAREHPERLAGTAAAFASIVKAMFITQRPTNEALDSVQVPVFVLWGRDDHVVDPTSLTQQARRPGWTPRPIDDVGHLLPVEAPDLYTQAVCQWLAVIPGFGRPT